jgi:hypothetical protein
MKSPYDLSPCEHIFLGGEIRHSLMDGKLLFGHDTANSNKLLWTEAQSKLWTCEVLLNVLVKMIYNFDARQVVFVLTTARTLYRSEDDGRTFQNIMSMLEDSETASPPFGAGVQAMYPSDADPR